VRVVVLSQWFPPEKAVMVPDIARGLVARGHDVTVLTGFPNYPNGKIYDGWRQRPWLDKRVDGYGVRRVALYPSHDSSPVRRASSYLSFGATSTAFGWSRLRAADVIYVYHPPLTAAMGPWLSRTVRGAPYVLHVQDLWPESVVEAGLIQNRSVAAVARLLTRVCDVIYSRASGIICIAPTMASMLHDRGVPERGLHVVPNWAEESVFFPAPQDKSVARNLGLAGLFTVMFAGNLGDLQGLDVAIRAAAEVRDLADFRLVLVGDGVARKSLESLVIELAADNVRFVPMQPLEAMNAVSGAADVQLVCLRDLPFFRGTIPSKLGTVMASGLPVICAVAGDASGLVQEAGAGWTCAPEDVHALAQVFRVVHATSAHQRAEKGRAARRYYETNLARELGVDRIEHVLRQALAT
jgi:glycosyltransferase involved in cell wall biosynthesis